MKYQLFEFAVLHLPPSKKDEPGKKPKLILAPDYIIAKDANEVMLQVARKIPEEYADKLDEVEIAVRPF